MTRPNALPVERTWRVLALAFIAAPVVIGIAMTVLLISNSSTSRNGQTITARPTGVSMVAVVVEVGLAIVMALVVELAGYRVAPLAPGTPEPQILAQTTQRFQSAMILRFALCEAVAIVSVAMAFIVDIRSPVNYWVGGALAVVLLALHVYPNGRVVDRMTAALESNGVRSPLPEMFNRSR